MILTKTKEHFKIIMKFETFKTLKCYTLYSTLIVITILLQRKVQGEPHCSKFHYEEQTLQKMIRLEFQMEKLKSEVGATQKRTSDMLNQLMDFKEKLSTEFADIKEQNRLDLDMRIEDVKVLKDSVSIPAIAFQARSPFTVDPKPDDKIVFTTTMHDSSECYNNKTGIFTAPTIGTYLFNVQLCLAVGSRYIYYSIHVESEAVTNTLLNDSADRFCNSATAIIHLQKNDNVYIKVTSTGGNALREAAHEWNIFSGVLINNE